MITQEMQQKVFDDIKYNQQFKNIDRIDLAQLVRIIATKFNRLEKNE